MLTRLSLLAGLVLFSSTANAQISASFTRQGNTVTGGGFVVGGTIVGGNYVRLGINASTSQLIDVQTFPFATFGVVPAFGAQGFANVNNFAGNNSISRRPQRPQPTLGQFVKVSMTFDEDRSGELDKEELSKMGYAMIREIKHRQRVAAGFGRVPQKNVPKGPNPQEQQFLDNFVNRSLTFDADKSEGLNRDETTRMAMALLRSMS